MLVTIPIMNFGIATFYKLEPIDIRKESLPHSGFEPRGFIILEYEDFVVLNTHIEPGERKIEQIELIANVQNEYEKPFIVTGDFNERDAIRFFKEFGFQDLGAEAGITFPALNARIDYIFARDILSYTTRVIRPILSDHHIVVSDIIITSEEEELVKKEEREKTVFQTGLGITLSLTLFLFILTQSSN
jgi:endonuclease/exonuclease/phosphatase family metal-dependent hydrolase